MMHCEVCKRKIPAVTVFRVSTPGEMPSRYRCGECLTPEQWEAIPEDVKRMVSIIENKPDSKEARRER